MRRAARVDGNHAEVVRALWKAGATVQSLASVGDGVPDLLVGYQGVNHLLEIKDGSKPPSRRRLTPDQEEWHAGWLGSVKVVLSMDDALMAIGAIPPGPSSA